MRAMQPWRDASSRRRLWMMAVGMAGAIWLSGCGGSDGSDGNAEPEPPPVPADRYPAIPTPTVTGPIASESLLSATNNYTFFASDLALGARGYVEEEFFIEGQANAYDAPGSSPAVPTTANANVVTPGLPYKTRMVVRRPADAARFNGTVVVEWVNVTNGFDGEYFWVQAKDLLLREGYGYVALSAQNVGISNATTGLKAFSATRYGSLDVTVGGTVPQDRLSYDIMSQTAKAVHAVPQVMGTMPIKNVIAAGMSQSAARLGVYANYIHMRAPIYDAFIIQVVDPVVRDDMTTPLIKVVSESEGTANTLRNSQPDTATRKTWYIAGATHGDAQQRTGRIAVQLRDTGPQNTPNDSCGPGGATPTRGRVPLKHVLSAAVHHLKQQVEHGTQPPVAPRLTTTGGDTPAIVRDERGNALGGIRLAHMEAPTARVHGTECGNVGAWVPFSTADLQALYPTHADYVAKVKAAVETSVAQGFVLPPDAATTIAAAEASVIGTGLECGALCLSVGHFRSDYATTGLLRDATAYYDTPDGQALLDAVDEAHLWTASGYSSTGAAARYNFGFAVSALQRYIGHVQRAQADGRMTATAATTLLTQANIVIAGLQALP